MYNLSSFVAVKNTTSLVFCPNTTTVRCTPQVQHYRPQNDGLRPLRERAPGFLDGPATRWQYVAETLGVVIVLRGEKRKEGRTVAENNVETATTVCPKGLPGIF